MKKLLISSSLIFISVFSFSQAKWNCGVNGTANVVAFFDADTQTLTISGKGEMGDLSPWKGLREAIKIVKINQGVTTIGKEAFGGGSWQLEYPNLETVFISNTVTRIGSSAFKGATSLRKIEIPNSVVEIGGGAFSGSGLENISLPYGVKYLAGHFVFRDCKSLKTVNLSQTQISEIHTFIFSGCEQLEDVYLPKEVIDIRWGTFAECKSLKSITYYNSNPPNIEFKSFSKYEFPNGRADRLDLSKITLYVPEASIPVYKISEVWKEFGVIAAIPAR